MVELTEAGRSLQAFVARGFAELRKGSAALRRDTRSGILRVNSVPIFATAFLASRIEDFEAKNCGLRIKLELTHFRAGFDTESADVVICIGAKVPMGTFSEPLLPLISAPVCTPALASRLSTVEDLSKVTRISTAQYPGGWEAWLRIASAGNVEARRELTFDAPNSALLAALDGTGVALAPLQLVTRHLDAGTLVMPFPVTFRSRHGYRLACRKGEEEIQKIVRFRRWLKGEIKDCRRSWENYDRMAV